MTELRQRSKILARIFYNQDGLYEDYARRHRLNGKSLSILMFIYYISRGVTQNWISKKTYSSKQVVNATIKKFLDKGYVFFEENPADKRHKKVKLTEAGRVYASRILDPLEEAEKTALSQFSLEEQEQLLDLFGRYGQALTEILGGETND
ncbi:TPA: winged helix-turn-helix transcriptional regulator [Streptococcus suis]|uniref:MarR family winged helix-turn-helix transcriptional regulator n=1 Tax=Streptococcus suis TaxID=1307 RepID=UPI000424954E|nr:MarR family winged helix-turn-helix transcriptional regulator [Streptococcus suis]HEM5160335.1 winged helix-turn-helix transcriptional regulator [Streptococcus suis]HEM5269339.1 winged helix-turn-helix transcriptional regulator [Streptococcus suis]